MGLLLFVNINSDMSSRSKKSSLHSRAAQSEVKYSSFMLVTADFLSYSILNPLKKERKAKTVVERITAELLDDVLKDLSCFQWGTGRKG